MLSVRTLATLRKSVAHRKSEVDMVGGLDLLVANGCRSIPGYQAMITTMRCSNRMPNHKDLFRWYFLYPADEGMGRRRGPPVGLYSVPRPMTNGTVGMENYFWVTIGGALRTMGRYWCSDFIARLVGETFPWVRW
jgi:hypothetical protein